MTTYTVAKITKALGKKRMAFVEDIDVADNGYDIVIDIMLKRPYVSDDNTIRVNTIEDGDTFKSIMDDYKWWIDSAYEDETFPSYSGHKVKIG